MAKILSMLGRWCVLAVKKDQEMDPVCTIERMVWSQCESKRRVVLAVLVMGVVQQICVVARSEVVILMLAARKFLQTIAR